jgi:N-acetyltransferase 10
MNEWNRPSFEVICARPFSSQVTQEMQGEAGKTIVRVDIFRDHRQILQYVLPGDHAKLAQAELVAVDEAAAIPLPVVKKLLSGGHMALLSSTIHGYEGTGRSLSLKLIQQLRSQQGAAVAAAAIGAGAAVKGPKGRGPQDSGQGRSLHEERWRAAAAGSASSLARSALIELTLNAPIRYGADDPVEKWLNGLLCMDAVSPTAAAATRLVGVLPAPRDCELFIVNRDALFSFHALSEAMLQRIWALYTAAHYKSSPNDLQMLSDAPAHRLFVLLGPQTSKKEKEKSKSQLPDVLCVLQVAFEGRISQRSVQSELAKGNKASGDMIPWTIASQFNDSEFSTLSGARIVRIATHPGSIPSSPILLPDLTPFAQTCRRWGMARAQ